MYLSFEEWFKKKFDIPSNLLKPDLKYFSKEDLKKAFEAGEQYDYEVNWLEQ